MEAAAVDMLRSSQAKHTMWHFTSCHHHNNCLLRWSITPNICVLLTVEMSGLGGTCGLWCSGSHKIMRTNTPHSFVPTNPYQSGLPSQVYRDLAGSTWCWEIILHGSLEFLYILRAEALTVPDCLCKDDCTVNSLGRQRKCLPPEQRAGMCTVQYDKDNIFPQSKGQAYLCLW